jgi:hypothetical protein
VFIPGVWWDPCCYLDIYHAVCYKKQELFILQELLASSQGFGGIRVVIYIGNTASVL